MLLRLGAADERAGAHECDRESQGDAWKLSPPA